MEAELAVRVIVNLATVAWATGEVLMRTAADSRTARAAWTVGLLLIQVHVLIAFQQIYGWDHEAAIAATVVQSEARFGLGWRGAIYINYAFLAIWTADVLWWWVAPVSRAARAGWLEMTRFAIFAFMFVNGAVIFASGIGRAVGVCAVSAVLIAALLPRRRPFPV